MNDYFGEFAGYKGLLFSENLTTGATAKIAMSLWKKSEGHYRNLLDLVLCQDLVQVKMSFFLILTCC
jgi:hypothetical protein